MSQAATKKADLIEQAKTLPFYQKIDLPDGSTTTGRADHRKEPTKIGLDGTIMKGKRVLDVAANDGFWSFWSESAGASDVLAIDVETYENYDWGMHGVPPELAGKTAKNKNFDVLRELFGSAVRREHISVYDLDRDEHGAFDVTLCYGLLYHLRHPLLAIDKLRGVTDGMLVLKTHTALVQPELPYTIFFLDDIFDKAVTNWTGASEQCVVHWMRDAGFEHVFVENYENPRENRRVFSKVYCGCVSEEMTAKMHANPRFSYCDAAYYARGRNAVHQALYAPKPRTPEPEKPSLVQNAVKQIKRRLHGAVAEIEQRLR